LGATLTDAMGNVLVNNGGSCTATAIVIGDNQSNTQRLSPPASLRQ